MDLARHAALASSPFPLETSANIRMHPTHVHLRQATEARAVQIRDLIAILAELGVHDLLAAVGDSPDAAMVSELPVDDYEGRLMREVGHRNPSLVVREFLRYAAEHREVMSDSAAQLEKGEKALLQVHGNINLVVNLGAVPAPKASAPAKDDAKPKRLKLFSGLTKIASGLVLLSGNAIVIPTVVMGSLTTLPVLGSLAAGIAAVGDGVSGLLREGE